MSYPIPIVKAWARLFIAPHRSSSASREGNADAASASWRAPATSEHGDRLQPRSSKLGASPGHELPGLVSRDHWDAVRGARSALRRAGA
jgi:hypothetical protein